MRAVVLGASFACLCGLSCAGETHERPAAAAHAHAADVGRVNLVVASDVTGTITLRLRRVAWDQALDVVVRAKGLEAERERDVILVRAAR